MSRQKFFIGTLAERAGVSADTIRYYEDEGILPAPERSEAGYRLYDRTTVERRPLPATRTVAAGSSRAAGPGRRGGWSPSDEDPDATVIARLQEMGVEVLMMTGDDERTARPVAEEAGPGCWPTFSPTRRPRR